MRRIFLLSSFVIVLCQFASAQEGFIDRWHVGGGLAFPSAPDQFYDYWKQGYQLFGAVELSGESKFVQVISFELSYFPFDAGRFLKRSGVDPASTTVSGSKGIIVSAAYLIKYTFTDYPEFQPAFFAGLGGASSFRTSATIEYVRYKGTQESTNSVIPVIPFGATVKLYEGESNIVEVSLSHTLGLSKKQTTNSNYTSLRLDLSLAN